MTWYHEGRDGGRFTLGAKRGSGNVKFPSRLTAARDNSTDDDDVRAPREIYYTRSSVRPSTRARSSRRVFSSSCANTRYMIRLPLAFPPSPRQHTSLSLFLGVARTTGLCSATRPRLVLTYRIKSDRRNPLLTRLRIDSPIYRHSRRGVGGNSARVLGARVGRA